jgi:hypothetical protein
MRLIVICCLCFTFVAGQGREEGSSPNSQLPLWTPPDSLTQVPNDTLTLNVDQKPLRTALFIRWVGAGLTIVSGALSYSYHRQAEEAYQAYLRTGNIAEMDRLYQRAAKLDRYVGITYVGVEVGLLLFAYSFYE